MSSAITRNNTAEFVNTSGDTMTGPLLLPDGTAAAPSMAFSSDADGTGTGIFRPAANNIGFAVNGGELARLGAGSLSIYGPGAFLSLAGSVLVRDGADHTIAQRSGTSAQTFRIYNTYTDAANYERGKLSFESNKFVIGTEIAGTGVARNILVISRGTQVEVGTSSAVRWVFDGTAFRPDADGSQDIGSSSRRVQSLFLSGGVTAGIVTKTTNYTATANDYTILVDATAGNVTITLPPAASHTGRIYTIKKIDASANTVSVDGDGAETIDGAGLLGGWNVQWRGYTIQSNGTSWFTISAKV